MNTLVETKLPQGMQSKLPGLPLWLPLLFLGLLVLTYWPCLTSVYAISDEYYLIEEVQKIGPACPAVLLFALAQGRPMDAALLFVVFSIAKTVPQLALMRLLGCVFFSAFATGLVSVLRRCNFSLVHSIAVAIVCLSLPSTQICVAWGLIWVIPLALAFAQGAFLIVDSEWFEKNRTAGMVSSSLLLLASMTTYQPAGMWFLACAALRFITRPEVFDRKRLMRYVAVFLITCACEAVIFKTCSTVWHDYLTPDRARFTEKWWRKAKWFVREPLFDALNLWRISPKVRTAYLVGAITLCGTSLIPGNWKSRLTRLALLVMVPFAIYAPNLVVAESFPSYRSKIALCFFIAIVFYWGLHTLLTKLAPRGVVDSGMLIGSVFAMMIACCSVNQFVVAPQVRELEVIAYRAGLLPGSRIQPKSADEIVTSKVAPWSPYRLKLPPIVVDRDEPLSGFRRYDEFGMPSSGQPWALHGMLEFLIHDAGQFGNP